MKGPAVDVQQLTAKIFVSPEAAVDQALLIPIFHRWIREARLTDELLIDVADYRHVPHGPGIMIIGDAGHYGLDERGGELGLLYQRKRDTLGPAAAKLDEVVGRVVRAAAALEGELAVHFVPSRLEIGVLSRLAAANDESSAAALTAELAALGSRLWGQVAVRIERREDDPRGPLRIVLTADSDVTLQELATRCA